MTTPQIIAHRGASYLAPENTLVAFRKAMEIGADGVEMDVQKTYDNELVIHHDYMVDMHTDISGQIYDLTMGELKALDFGSWKGAIFQDEKIATLQEAMELCRQMPGCTVHLELKSTMDNDPEFVPRVVDAILGPEGEVLETLSPVCKRQVLKAETSQTMREMMEAVVLYGGGRNARITGYRVGGKSGTSQKLDSADEKARIASFVAVAPIDDPQFLCLVCLDEPHSWTTAGGSLSAPVCAEVLEQTLVYKGVPRAADTGSADAQAAALPADGDSFDGA